MGRSLPQRLLLCVRAGPRLPGRKRPGLRRTRSAGRSAVPCRRAWTRSRVPQAGSDDCAQCGVRCRQPHLYLRCWILPGAGKGSAALRHAADSVPGSRLLGLPLRVGDSWLELDGALFKFDALRRRKARINLGTGVSCPLPSTPGIHERGKSAPGIWAGPLPKAHPWL